MGSPRALFASIGVSVSLIAAAALSLFAVSIVIAFGGWSAGMGESAPPATLVFGATTTTPSKSRHDAAAVVLRAPAQRPRQRTVAAPPRAASKPARTPAARIVRSPSVTHAPVLRPKPDHQPPAATEPAPAAKHVPATGDAVRRLGDDLSSVAQNTGKALGDVTAPLAPPVSSALKKVLDVVATALQRTTDGLGGALDKLNRR